MTRLLTLLLLLGQVSALAAEAPAVAPPLFDKQGRPTTQQLTVESPATQAP